jgi:hypothetical protein
MDEYQVSHGRYQTLRPQSIGLLREVVCAQRHIVIAGRGPLPGPLPARIAETLHRPPAIGEHPERMLAARLVNH